MCLAPEHNSVLMVRLEPATPRSQVKHSTTKPLRCHKDPDKILCSVVFHLGLHCQTNFLLVSSTKMFNNIANKGPLKQPKGQFSIHNEIAIIFFVNFVTF